MSKIDLSKVSAVCEVKDFNFVNEFLDLGWKLISTDNKFTYEYNPEIRKEEKLNFTCYSVVWAEKKENIKYPQNYIENTSPF